MKRYSALDFIIATVIILTTLVAAFTARVWALKLGAAYLLTYRGTPDATYQMVNSVAIPVHAIASVECRKNSGREVTWYFHTRHGWIVRIVTRGSDCDSLPRRPLPVVQSWMKNPRSDMVCGMEVYKGALWYYILFINYNNEIVGYLVVNKD